MHRLLYAVLVGLFGAGIVHIAVLLLLPQFSERDAWSRLASRSSVYAVTRIDSDADPFHRPADPFFQVAACRFDLTNSFAHLTARGNVPFWSVSVYDRNGQNIYSLNDRTATDGELDVVVATPAQMIDIRKELPAEVSQSIFVQADVDEGIAVVRLFVPEESWESAIARYLGGMQCREG